MGYEPTFLFCSRDPSQPVNSVYSGGRNRRRKHECDQSVGDFSVSYDAGSHRPLVEAVGVGADAIECPDPVPFNLKIRDGQYNPDLAAGYGQPAMHVVSGTTFFVSEVDILQSAPTTATAGLAPLQGVGQMASFDWTGVALADSRVETQSDGYQYIVQEWFKDAAWMDSTGKLRIRVEDANNNLLSVSRTNPGAEDSWESSDDFMRRAFNARIVTSNCETPTSCAQATVTREAEALMHLSSNLHPAQNQFTIPANSDHLRVRFDQAEWVIPLVLDTAGSVDYGLTAEISLTNVPSSGFYLPGDAVSAQVLFKDRNGTLLFPAGDLPSYMEVLTRADSSNGLRYLTFFDNPTLYWAHKHTQGAAERFLSGPVDQMTDVGTFPLTPYDLFNPEIVSATVAVDGWSGVVQETPDTPIMFGCLLDLQSAACGVRPSNTYTFHVPSDAQPGTYITGMKMRREWKGSVYHAAAVTKLQVGTTTPTLPAKPDVAVSCGDISDCKSCHKASENTDIPSVGHGFNHLDGFGANKVTLCLGCHSGVLYFESTAPLPARLEEIHCNSDRLAPPF